MANVVPVRLPQLRVRSWLSRLPLFTRAVLVVIVLFHIAGFFTSLTEAAALTPSEITLVKSPLPAPFHANLLLTRPPVQTIV